MLRTFSRAVLVMIIAAAALTFASPQTVWADDGIGGVHCDPGSTEPGCTVDAGTPGGGGGSTGGQSSGDGICHGPSGAVIPCHSADGDAGSDGCYYRLATAADGIDPAAPGPGGSGAWYVKTCSDDPNLSSQALLFLPTAPVVTPEVLAQQARSMLRLPRVVVSLSPAGDQLVNHCPTEDPVVCRDLPTWLSLAAGSWAPQSATAAVAGVSVTATATPVRAVWAMGDGSPPVTCTGPGTPWRAGLDPSAASPDCGYRYTRSSAGQPGAAFTVTVTVTWNVSWAGAGAAGTVAGLTTAGVVAVRVAESQAVLTT